MLAGILGTHSTESSIHPSLSLSLIIPLCLIDAAHPPSQPTVTVLEMSKGKYFSKVQSKTQVSKGGRVPREGISRHKDAAALLQRSSSASVFFFFPPLRLHRESRHHRCSLRMNFFFSPLVHTSLAVEAAVVVKGRTLLFIFFLLRYRRSPRMLSCVYISHRWGGTTLTESRRLFLDSYVTFIPFFFFKEKAAILIGAVCL